MGKAIRQDERLILSPPKKKSTQKRKRGRPAKVQRGPEVVPEVTTKEFTRRYVMEMFSAGIAKVSAVYFKNGNIQRWRKDEKGNYLVDEKIHSPMDWLVGYEDGQNDCRNVLVDLIGRGIIRTNIDKVGKNLAKIGKKNKVAVGLLVDELPDRYHRKYAPRKYDPEPLRKLDRTIRSFPNLPIGPTLGEVARAMEWTEDQVKNALPEVNKLKQRQYRIIPSNGKDLIDIDPYR